MGLSDTTSGCYHAQASLAPARHTPEVPWRGNSGPLGCCRAGPRPGFFWWSPALETSPLLTSLGRAQPRVVARFDAPGGGAIRAPGDPVSERRRGLTPAGVCDDAPSPELRSAELRKQARARLGAFDTAACCPARSVGSRRSVRPSQSRQAATAACVRGELVSRAGEPWARSRSRHAGRWGSGRRLGSHFGRSRQARARPPGAGTDSCSRRTLRGRTDRAAA